MARCVLFVLFVLFALFALSVNGDRSFVIENQRFVKDGTPTVLLSGSFHYFRVHPSYWRDRLIKMWNCGLNAVQTYIPWNLHNPEPGVFNFDGFADIVQFIQTAQSVGLMVVLRPGPYSCAEWEYGGLPYWVRSSFDDSGNNNDVSSVRVRSSDPVFMDRVTQWWNVLLPLLEPLIYANGGPIVLVQVENEYGSYGNDKTYLGALTALLVDNLGSNVLIHSTDGPNDEALTATYLGSQVYQTVDFGIDENPPAQFQEQRKFQPNGPLMNSEYYSGWFTHWGDSSMATISTPDLIRDYSTMLSMNASVNFYIFVGCSNFGFFNGANLFVGPEDYHSVVTSYDYDAPVSENGTIKDKYYQIQKTIAQYFAMPDPIPTDPLRIAAYGTLSMTGQASLFDSLSVLSGAPVESTSGPWTFEQLGQAYGFVLYRTSVWFGGLMTIQDVRERAYVYVSGEFAGMLSRNISSSGSVTINAPQVYPFSGGSPTQVDILVENQGRVNYGNYMEDGRQGITQGVLLDTQFQYNFTMFGLPMTSVTASQLPLGPVSSMSGPAFFVTTFNIADSQTSDTYVDMTGWGKGQIWVNGFNVGRYWSTMGPQYSFYVPAAVLVTGVNEVVIFELESTSTTSITLTDQFVTS